MATDYADIIERQQPVLNFFEQLENEGLVKLVPVLDLFCPPGENRSCTVVTNGQALYTDDDHLSAVGAEMVADRVIELAFPELAQ